MRVTGIDPDERATRWAAAHDRGAGVTYRTVASGALVEAGESYDAVISNHMLHHLTPGELAGVLSDSEALARGVAVHNDLRRSRTAWLIYWVATLPLARARTFVRFDGLLSIRRSHTPAELATALPPGWQAVGQRGHPVDEPRRAAAAQVVVHRHPACQRLRVGEHPGQLRGGEVVQHVVGDHHVVALPGLHQRAAGHLSLIHI